MNLKVQVEKSDIASGAAKEEISLLEIELIQLLNENDILDKYLDPEMDTQGLSGIEIEELFLNGIKYDNNINAAFKDARSAAKMLGLPIN
jgi:hypothetical protein